MSQERTYYDRPVIKEPVWKPEIALYLFAGGLAGASAGLGLLARARGARRLARSCTLAAAAAAAASPPLLIEDLGRPLRFHHMLRVFKITSPMSVGTWILSSFGASIGLAAASELTGLARPAGTAAGAAAGVLGMPLATYTGALFADTSIPVWHGARRVLPFLFAASAAASAGALATITTPDREAAPARRLAVAGAVAEVALAQTMERTLGEAGRPYREGTAGRLGKVAQALVLAGAAGIALSGGRRLVGAAGGAGVMAGSLLERFSIWRAGSESARATVR